MTGIAGKLVEVDWPGIVSTVCEPSVVSNTLEPILCVFCRPYTSWASTDSKGQILHVAG